MGNGHILRQPVVAIPGKHHPAKHVIHKTGSQVVCGKCGAGFILIADDDYARLLARAVAGAQK